VQRFYLWFRQPIVWPLKALLRRVDEREEVFQDEDFIAIRRYSPSWRHCFRHLGENDIKRRMWRSLRRKVPEALGSILIAIGERSDYPNMRYAHGFCFFFYAHHVHGRLGAHKVLRIERLLRINELRDFLGQRDIHELLNVVSSKVRGVSRVHRFL